MATWCGRISAGALGSARLIGTRTFGGSPSSASCLPGMRWPLVAAISPYRAAREAARREIGRFVEVYVNCPLEICMGRDIKGLYKRAVAGEIPAFTGISDPYEPPLSPELTLHTDKESLEESTTRVIQRLRELGFLPE